MPEFDFDNIAQSEVEWPKRGRKPKPIPEALLKALHNSVATESVPNLVLQNDQVQSFSNLLSSVGKKLNMRIERHIEVDTPKKGYSTFHFRARGKRNKDLPDE